MSSERPNETSSVSWELVVVLGWRKLAGISLAALGLASTVWQLRHRELLFGMLLSARDAGVRQQQVAARGELFTLTCYLLPPALLFGLYELWRLRRGRAPRGVHGELLVFSLAALPPLGLPAIEVQHPYLTALLVVWFSAAVAFAAARILSKFSRRFHEPSERLAWVLVFAAWVLFVGVMGFLSHWRYITFHAPPCDFSFEVNAVWGIVHHGLPMDSIGAFMYGDKPLPQPYLNNHTPYIYYLFAPFYAFFQDGRTLVWLQAAYMGAGTFGVFLFARRWLESRLLAVLAAWLYVMHPNIQSYCLHDLHANTLAIPTLLLALGLMEANRPRWAVLLGVLTALCREETPLYSAGLALYWLFGGADRTRIRYGLALLVSSAVWLVFNSSVIMPAFGGHPRWEHFSLFFDTPDSLTSAGKALALNPVGAAYGFANDLSLTYLVYCLLPVGFLALWGLRTAWLTLPAVGLMLTSGSPGFYCPGMNYSAALVPAAIVMGVSGWQWWLRREAVPAPEGGTSVRRVAVTAYVLAAGVLSSYLYGNFLSKGYQLEYGYSPLRRQNEHDRADLSGWVTALPPFGRQERAIWQALAHVPKAVKVAATWAVTAQLSDRGVALALGYSTPDAADRVDFVVVDKLPMMQVRTEPLLAQFRGDARFKLRFENEGAAVFERKEPLPAD